tara:strand:+ start:483 stop:683 length:201 start_codon:yes stop_codon:yes gene_type:complete
MLSDYFNKNAISELTFEEFESRWNGNIEIVRHKLSMKEAFIELGGTFKTKEKVFKVVKKSKKKSFS